MTLLVIVIGCLAVLIAMPVRAVSVTSDGVPQEAKSGEEVTATFTVTDLYTDYGQWTLRGETDLRDVTWMVQQFDQAGNQISQQSYTGQSFSESISLDSDASKVKVAVTGTVPEPTAAEQTFRFVRFQQRPPGGTSRELTSWQVPFEVTAQTTTSERRTPTSFEGATATERDFQRGFFTNNPSQDLPWAFLKGPEITILGFLLSIIGILLQLTRGD